MGKIVSLIFIYQVQPAGSSSFKVVAFVFLVIVFIVLVSGIKPKWKKELEMKERLAERLVHDAYHPPYSSSKYEIAQIVQYCAEKDPNLTTLQKELWDKSFKSKFLGSELKGEAKVNDVTEHHAVLSINATSITLFCHLRTVKDVHSLKIGDTAIFNGKIRGIARDYNGLRIEVGLSLD
jgi:hypothetical protein